MVNYDNGVIYKIVYNNIIHYVGSSTNFKKRRLSHKNCCNDINDAHHNTPLYTFMRNNDWNGNWGIWTIEIVEFCPCKTIIELKTRERYFIDEYNPILNVKSPLQTREEWNIVNKEKTKIQRATFHKNNSERLNAKSSAYYQENRQAMNASSRTYYANNVDDRKIKNAKYNSDNKEKIKLQKALAYKLKKEKINLTI